MWVAMSAESSVPSRKGGECAKPFRELQFLMTRARGGLGERWKYRDGQRELFMETQELFGASHVAQLVKNMPAMLETWVQFLGWEDPVEKEIGNPLQYACLENPMGRGAWQATVHSVARVVYILVLSFFLKNYFVFT